MTPADPNPAPPAKPLADHRVVRLEIVISYVLRIGVIASLIIVVAGLAVTFSHHPLYTTSHAEFQRLTRPSAEFPHSLSVVFAGITETRGQAITTVGLLLLILTPVIRVAVTILAFVYQRDRIFTLLTTAVFLILLFSFVVGHARAGVSFRPAHHERAEQGEKHDGGDERVAPTLAG